MKAKKLVLCLLLSVALVVTFIPMVSFAEGDTVDKPTVEETAATEDVEAVVEESEEAADIAINAKDKLGAKDIDEGATAEFVAIDGRTLVIDYDNYLDPWKDGDKFVITYSDDNTEEYVYDESEEDFYNSLDELLYVNYDSPLVGDTSMKVNVWAVDEDSYVDFFDVYFTVPVKVKSSVKSISFSPASITVYSEDIAEKYDDTVNYNLWNRHHFSFEGNDKNSAFDEGDSITVNYSNGQSKVFQYKTYVTYVDGDNTYNDYDYFVNGDELIWPNDWFGFDELSPGKNNTVKIIYGGAAATFNVFVDTPELRAQRAAAAAAARAEAARQGVYSASMPAAKASKPKTAKKSITIKWKKLKKKQLKSGVSRFEVWVCTNTAFARGATIEKTVGKKKASIKIKGLQKGVTYYAKVRTIKYVGGQKIVGKWSGVKKVKVK